MNLSLYVGMAALASPLEVGTDRAGQAADDLGRLLESSGCRVVPVDTVGLLRLAREADAKVKKQAWKMVKKNATCSAVSNEAGMDAAGIYLAIKKIVADENLSVPADTLFCIY